MNTSEERKLIIVDLAAKARESMHPEFKVLSSDEIMHFIRGADDKALEAIRIKMNRAKR